MLFEIASCSGSLSGFWVLPLIVRGFGCWLSGLPRDVVTLGRTVLGSMLGDLSMLGVEIPLGVL